MKNYFSKISQNNIWKMAAIRFFFWMHFISSVLIPFFRDWGGLSLTKIMILNACFMVFVFLTEIPTGTVADRFGRKVSIVLACPVSIGAVLLYTSLPIFWIFLAGEFLFAVAYTLMSGADEALVYDSLQEYGAEAESKRIFARLESVKLAGILVGALLGSVIAKYYGLVAPVRMHIIPLLLSLFIALLLREPAASQPTTSKNYRRIMFDGVRFFLRHKTLKLLAFDMVSVNAVCFVIIWFYQPLVGTAGLDLIYFGTVHAAMTVGQIVILTNVERIERFLGSKRRLLLLSAIIPAAAFIILGVTQYLPLVICGVLLASYFGLARGPLFVSYMNKFIPSDQRATALSTASMFRMLAMAILNPVAGVLADWNLQKTMLILAGCLLLFTFVSRVREDQLVD
jgi:MFS family permease